MQIAGLCRKPEMKLCCSLFELVARHSYVGRDGAGGRAVQYVVFRAEVLIQAQVRRVHCAAAHMRLHILVGALGAAYKMR